ncbi:MULTISPECIES: nucleoside triphosphate pyrophosphohydrolase [unclassified Vibrio]|uniref:Nucleoside triphosphate pyrophosphohydrolase n=1 Tax=Vibrio sp. HB236076 TaxID=3232307 RepID=A0AB39HEL8_9VIBR|nr:nucleoside triphosphate pyrophosphohydrolase [Vibrio sp. HB161653]MDP5253962.1 nucleoside triphosphate pyrophosphohydrolase [Vibrio sp. HB161653]
MDEQITKLRSIMAQLRDPEKGCPWDLKQDFESIIPHTIEETYEVIDAILQQDWHNLKEELGDLLFQVIFYSQLAQEQKRFDFDDVVAGINDKLIHRHPHVFADPELKAAVDLDQQWERLKAVEKAKNGQQPQQWLDSVPRSLPALSRAVKLQKKCAKVGFDWSTLGPVVDKVQEEIDEVMDEAQQVTPDQDAIEMEVGDLLFATVNLARHLKVDPEVALAKANQKFTNRFHQVEAFLTQNESSLEQANLEQMEAAWQQVKQKENL